MARSCGIWTKPVHEVVVIYHCRLFTTWREQSSNRLTIETTTCSNLEKLKLSLPGIKIALPLNEESGRVDPVKVFCLSSQDTKAIISPSILPCRDET